MVPKLPSTGILLGPSKSGKTVALISMILEQYRGCFERIYIFSPSINVDDGWRPVKQYIEETMKVPTDREQVYFEDWDEAALRPRVYDPSKPPWMQQPWQHPTQWGQQTSADSAATVTSLPGPAGRIFGRKKKSMTTI